MTDQQTTQTIYPTLRYADADAAIAFLTKAFGFTEVVAYRDDSGTVGHAQLSYGPSSVMLGQAGQGEYDDLVRDHGPAALYVVVEDVHAHFTAAKAAGAEIVWEPREQSYGSTDYIARDSEGNLWTFGTYGGESTP